MVVVGLAVVEGGSEALNKALLAAPRESRTPGLGGALERGASTPQRFCLGSDVKRPHSSKTALP